MKKTLFLILSLICFVNLDAQDSGHSIYILHFADKGVGKSVSVNPADYLSDKAVNRRLKQKIAFDQADLPVNDQYIKAVSDAGAKVLARSRWFNTVVIEANATIINEISSLSYVSKTELLDKNAKTRSLSDISIKPSFEYETIVPSVHQSTKNGTADMYNYGAALNQINQIKGQHLHNLGYSGEGMTIAVFDAGFNSVNTLTCFDSLRANNQIKGTYDFAQPGNDVYSTAMASHGTSVLSCMAAYINGQMVGTAPKADYWLLRSEVGATETILEEYYWVSAAEFADSVGADLINSSLGYITFDNPATDHTYADLDGNTTVATRGADKAAEKGILVVNSAGNSGNGIWKYIGAPADGDSVFTIGAVTAAGIRSGFSSVGPTSDGRIKPTVVAQGSSVALYSPGGLGTGSGTSFSSPIICGMTACLWQAFPGLNNMQIIDLITASASQASQPDSLLGYGIPDYEKASSTLSVNNQNILKSLLAFPNPVADKLTIGFPASIQGDFNLEIINIQGKVVYAEYHNNGPAKSIAINDIGFLSSGIYFLKVSDQSVLYTGKIIKM